MVGAHGARGVQQACLLVGLRGAPSVGTRASRPRYSSSTVTTFELEPDAPAASVTVTVIV
jgi:hypothetical protein